ncbi:MAG: VCBS repeat-containing protein [Proteobacteria bacterium]|nr:VCBS repeat-containing protein [Pseudomonadota bacterium]
MKRGLISFLFFLMFFSINAYAQEKIGIIPFKVFGPYEVQYLKDALPEMLYSRLPFQNKEILRKEQLKDLLKGYETKDELSQAKYLLERTDYSAIIMGAFTKLGDAISLDVKILRRGDANFKPFYITTDKEAKLFSALEDLSSNVIAHIQGKPVQEKIVVKEVEKPAYEPSKKEFPRTAIYPLPYKPSGMVLADINGDGKEEIVIATKNEIIAYIIENNNLKEISKGQYKGISFLSIDAGDFNKNNKDEIYLVGLNNEEVFTHIFEFDKGAFSKIGEFGWYVRVLDIPGKGKTLVGQRSGPNDAFSGDVYALFYKAGNIFPEKPLGLAKDLNIYQILPIKFKGTNMIAYFDESDYLKIMDEKGKIVTRLKDRYGGSTLGVFKGIDDYREKKFVPIHPRMFRIEDKDTDMILTIKNEGMRLFLKSKGFDSGKVALLKFDGASYKEEIITQDINGYLSDITIDKDKMNILVSVISEVEEGKIYVFQNIKK